MTVILAMVTGALFTGGLYMMLRRNLVKILIGIVVAWAMPSIYSYLSWGAWCAAVHR